MWEVMKSNPNFDNLAVALKVTKYLKPLRFMATLGLSPLITTILSKYLPGDSRQRVILLCGIMFVCNMSESIEEY
jgi:hypothetical protein